MKKIPLLLPAICVICILAVQLVLTCTHGGARILAEQGSGIDRTHETGQPEIVKADCCPACPEHDHGDPGHDHLCCDHHSPLYSLTGSAGLTPPSQAARILVCDPLAYLPVVYLERFIPPQNLA